jgi:hypothetical protein
MHIEAPLFEAIFGGPLSLHDSTVVGVHYRFEAGKVTMRWEVEFFHHPWNDKRERFYVLELLFEGALAESPYAFLGREIFREAVRQEGDRLVVELAMEDDGSTVEFSCNRILEVGIREAAGTVRH